jgi:ferric-dicitrate binding protein FerR (iron transport regulator)
MKHKVPFNIETDAIRKQACDWIVTLDYAEDFTPELWSRFEDWLDLKPVHRTVYLRTERHWRRACDLLRGARLRGTLVFPIKDPRRVRREKRKALKLKRTQQRMNGGETRHMDGGT